MGVHDGQRKEEGDVLGGGRDSSTTSSVGSTASLPAIQDASSPQTATRDAGLGANHMETSRPAPGRSPSGDPPGETPAGGNGSTGDENPDHDEAATADPENPPDRQLTKVESAPEVTRTKLQTALIVGSLCSALFLAALDTTIITTAIPRIASEFDSTFGYTWIGSAYLLGNSASVPSWGKISDIWGRKPILLLAAAVFWIGSLLAGVSVSMAMLIAARAIQGVGGGGIVVLVNICITDLFSMRERGFYYGIMGMVWAVAGALGPVLGGVFTTEVTWRWCFYVNLPIAGVSIIILILVLKLHNPRTPMREGLAAIDWLGSATIIGGTLMFLLGLEFGGVTFSWSSATVICLIVFGVLTMGLFVLNEWKFAEFPVIPLRLFKERSNVAALAVCACHGYVFMSASYYLPLYFQAVLGASALMSGVYLLPYAISLAAFSSVAGISIKKTGMYLPFIIGGLTIMALGFGLFIDLPTTAYWPKIILYQLVAGMGVGPNFQSPLIALQNHIEPRDMASGTAMYAFTRQLFTSISVVIGSVVFQNEMQKKYLYLLSELGQDLADKMSGAEAAANVDVVGSLTGEQGQIAKKAYADSLKSMFIMYAAFAGLALVLGFGVKGKRLSKAHKEHKTGLGVLKEGEKKSGEKNSEGVAEEAEGRTNEK
ncbi:hypothetical protein MKZ38_003347 [Zalerion maritima]|uniref:Efflux pump dotC n=1 Tax=Zalerion maritima TaxID=339359 RepID=A0AAD5RMT8_9PEZI|nr:hypothetical protein MKZ38_003347 [Zalerion maritima]